METKCGRAYLGRSCNPVNQDSGKLCSKLVKRSDHRHHLHRHLSFKRRATHKASKRLDTRTKNICSADI